METQQQVAESEIHSKIRLFTKAYTDSTATGVDVTPVIRETIVRVTKLKAESIKKNEYELAAMCRDGLHALQILLWLDKGPVPASRLLPVPSGPITTFIQTCLPGGYTLSCSFKLTDRNRKPVSTDFKGSIEDSVVNLVNQALALEGQPPVCLNGGPITGQWLATMPLPRLLPGFVINFVEGQIAVNGLKLPGVQTRRDLILLVRLLSDIQPQE